MNHHTLHQATENFHHYFPVNKPGKHGFNVINDYFEETECMVTFAMLKILKPSTIIDLNGGYHSWFIDVAIQMLGLNTRHLVAELEPKQSWGDKKYTYPHTHIKSLYQLSKKTRLLKANDIVFYFNNNHNYEASKLAQQFYEEILPVLPSCRVYINDVFAGFKYPVKWNTTNMNELHILKGYLQATPNLSIEFFTNKESIQGNLLQKIRSYTGNSGGGLWLMNTKEEENITEQDNEGFSMIGIVITCYNRPGLLKRTLFDLKRTKGIDKTSIFIIDDNSTDKRTKEIITEFEIPGVQIEKYFRQKNCNMFANLKKGFDDFYEKGFKYLANIDSDAEMNSFWLMHLFDKFLKNTHDYILSGFNTPDHPFKGDCIDGWGEKENTGGINLMFHRDLYHDYVRPALTDEYWDWRLGTNLAKDDLCFLVPAKSLIEHKGRVSSIKGKDKAKIKPAIAQNFHNDFNYVIDVIIVSYAKDKALREVTEEAINTCRKSAGIVIPNIIVVESNHQTPIYRGANVTIYYEGKSFNYNKALNQARLYCKSKYVVFCNNDLVFGNYWADKIISYMECHPKISSCSPYAPSAPAMSEKYGNSKENFIFNNEVSYAFAGWCFVIPSRILAHIGKFNEDVEFWYSDNIVVEQLKSKNYDTHVLVKNAIVDHVQSTTLSKIDKKIQKQYTSKSKFATAMNNINKAIHFVHSGNIGDIIAALPTINHYCRQEKLKAEIHLIANKEQQAQVGSYMPIDRMNYLRPLLLAQPYVQAVCYAPNRDKFNNKKIIDLNFFRQAHKEKPQGLFSCYFRQFGLSEDLLESTWLHIPGSAYQKYDVIVARTERYQNKNMDYHYTMQDFTNKRVAFLGTKDEFTAILHEIPNITYLQTDNMLEAAMHINQCETFIGNQNIFALIAFALKKQCMIEMVDYAPSLDYDRDWLELVW